VLVTELELEYAVYSGVRQRADGVDLVTLQEEHEARLERGIGLEAWGGMELFEKALLIATRRNRFAMANQQAEAEIRKSIQDSKRRGRK
jgi:hypothetical protein